MVALVVETLSSPDSFTKLEADWRALESRAAPGVPFFTFDWAAAWWTHLRESRLGIRDALRLRAVRSPAGELVGIAPMMITSRPGFTALSGRQLQFFGSDPNITELRGPLASPEDTTAVCRALVDDFRACATDWDWLVLSAPAGHPGFDEPPAPFSKFELVREVPNYLLRLEPTWEKFKAKLGRNIKESLRRCTNAPKRDGVLLDFEVVSDPARVRDGLDSFFDLHRDRAESSAAVRHNNVFASAASRRFLLDVCERFAQRGAFRLFRLRSGDRIVAARLGFLVTGALYLYYSGHDRTFARYSIMTTVVARALQYAIEHGISTVNLSTGNDVSKTRWSPEEVRYREWLAVSPSRRGRLAFEVSRRLRDVLRGSTLPKLLVAPFTRRAD